MTSLKGANAAAYALKVRLLSLCNEDFDYIVEQVPEQFRSFQEIAGALGDAAGKCRNLQKCQYWFGIAYRDKNAIPEIAVAYATSMLISIVENKLALRTGTITKGQITQLENILDIYTGAYAKIADSECLALKLDCLFHRGIAWRMIGNYEKAAKDFDLALELDPTNDTYVFHRAELALLSGKKEVAISLLEQMKESKEVPATLVLAEIYQKESAPATGREILRKYLADDPPPAFKEQAHRLFIELLTASGNDDEADKESAHLLAASQEDVPNLLLRADVLKSIEREEEARECLMAAQKLVNKDSPFFDILDLADKYYEFKDYENAVLFYELIVDISVNNYITRNLLTCHYSGSLKS